MFDKKYEDRLLLWREFRESLETSDDPLQDVVSFYSSAPLVSIQTDPYTQENWPTPWEILYHKLYCQNTVSLLIYHTLHILLEDPADLKIILIDDTRNRFLVPTLEDKYIFNYVLGVISNIHDYKEIIIVDDFEDQIVHNDF